MLERFVAHRRDVVTRRTRYELRKAREREHILLGLQIALDHIDEIIALIRAAPDRDAARDGLIARFGLSELQAKAILEMQLQRLTGLERQKILDELAEVQKLIARLQGDPRQRDGAARRHQGRAPRGAGALRRRAPHRDPGRGAETSTSRTSSPRRRWSSPSPTPAT